MALRMAMSVCRPVHHWLIQWYKLIYFNNCWMHCHETVYRHSWSPEDESQWLWWSPDFTSSTTSRTKVSPILWNISTSPRSIGTKFCGHSWLPEDESHWLWMIPWLFLECTHQFKVSICPVLWFTTKYLQDQWHSHQPQLTLRWWTL